MYGVRSFRAGFVSVGEPANLSLIGLYDASTRYFRLYLCGEVLFHGLGTVIVTKELVVYSMTFVRGNFFQAYCTQIRSMYGIFVDMYRNFNGTGKATYIHSFSSVQVNHISVGRFTSDRTAICTVNCCFSN